MYSHFDYKFNTTIISIHPGEYYATGEQCLISTVLGSCVSIVLYDEVHKKGGMNHFMLPGEKFVHEFTESTYNPLSNAAKGKLGTYALDLLLDALDKAGAKRENLKAKVFGGGNVLGQKDMGGRISDSDIGKSNVRKAFTLLELSNIPIVSSDVRGEIARKIYLDPISGYVYLKRLERQLLEPVRKVEQSELLVFEKKPVAYTSNPSEP